MVGGSTGVALLLYIGRMCGFCPSLPPLVGELVMLASGGLSIWLHMVARRRNQTLGVLSPAEAEALAERTVWGHRGGVSDERDSNRDSSVDSAFSGDRGLAGHWPTVWRKAAAARARVPYREILATLTILLWFFVLSYSAQALDFVRLLLVGVVCETIGWLVPSYFLGHDDFLRNMDWNGYENRTYCGNMCGDRLSHSSVLSREPDSGIKSGKIRDFSETALAENRAETDKYDNRTPSDHSAEWPAASVSTSVMPPKATPVVMPTASVTTDAKTAMNISEAVNIPEAVDIPAAMGGPVTKAAISIPDRISKRGVDDAEQGHWTQRVIRSVEADGTERLECWFRIRLPALRKQVPIHLPIFPPLEREPCVEFEPESGPEVEIAVVQKFCQGIRLEIRRVGVVDQAEELVLHVEIAA